MGRRNRSSSFGNSFNSFSSPQPPHHQQHAAHSAAGTGTLTPQIQKSPIDISACTSVLNILLHGRDANGRTFLHRAVQAASASSSSSADLMSSMSSSSDAREDRKLDGLFLIDAMANRAKELDAASKLAGAAGSAVKTNKGSASVSRAKSSPSATVATASSAMATTGAAAAAALSSSSSSAAGAVGGGGGPATTSGGGENNMQLGRMMLAKDVESGYTGIHYAILRRDLLSLLLLLKHVTTPNFAFENDPINPNHQMQHPLRLLDGNLGDNETYTVMNELASSLDNEHFTPLRLLGATSASELERCRKSLQWKNLKKSWNRESTRLCSLQSEVGSGEGDRSETITANAADASNASNTANTFNPRRYRRRMISFGDDRDNESLNYDIEEAPDRERREQRSRSGNFNVNGYHDDEDEGEASNRGVAGGGNNDLVPLDADFSILNANNEEGENEVPAGERDPEGRNQRHSNNVKSNEVSDDNPRAVDYGCEVFTFGRADHCALGVPQFSTAGRRERRGDDNFGGSRAGMAGGNDDANNSASKSYKPRRVEAFALGEMRRCWVDADADANADVPASAPRENSGVDSPAVAVAAAAHHTLVVTRGGRLFSFGLGKGGRLGTGDENHRHHPTRVGGALMRRVVASIAAAENHSLCATSDGDVFAWGSNGFGQMGMSNQDQNGSRLSPRRVEDLKHHFVVAVSAGDRHSVALTRLGEVYTWGDNRSGQLGSLTAGSPSSSQANGRCCHRPLRVEGLWSVGPRRRAIAIAAAEFSTLVLTLPPTASDAESSLAALPVNVIYGWGHGNHVPMRVMFPTVSHNNSFAELSGSAQNDSIPYTRSTCVNPTAIAQAKYHSVAITADGRVFTWGLHSESLGLEKSSSAVKSDGSNWETPLKAKGTQNSSVVSSPQLVVAMLPENGGGRAVAVSASESHTAIVTADGHLFTWGSSYGSDVLGHKGVRWQPCPRKVKRVHRAVGVSSAKEHTALLIGTSFPALPRTQPSSDEVYHPDSKISALDDSRNPSLLQGIAATEIARNVDLFNVIPVANVAHRLNCRPLLGFCEKFVKTNLDGVLSVGNAIDFEMFLANRAISSAACERFAQCDGSFHPLLYCLSNSKCWMEESHHILELFSARVMPKQNKKLKKHEKVQRQVEGKKSVEIVNKTDDSLQNDECKDEKLVCLADNEKSPVSRKLFEANNNLGQGKASGDAMKYHCKVCGVSCPDNDSYVLHVNGRKHRNRLHHFKVEEEKKVAENMMAMKRLQLMENNRVDIIFEDQMMKGKLASPSLPSKNISNEESSKPKTAWASPKVITPNVDDVSSIQRIRSNSFREILNEEQRKSLQSQKPLGAAIGNKMSARCLNSQAMATSSAVAMKQFQFKDTKRATAASAAKAPPSAKDPSSPRFANKSASPAPSFSLSAFLEGSNEEEHAQSGRIDPSLRKWGSKPDSSHISHITQSNTRSFFDIQKEEEDMSKKEDHICKIGGNKWYIHQRQRAASIGEIQEQQRKDSEFLLLVEEQKQIEEEIMRENERKKKLQNARKKRYGRKKQSNNGKCGATGSPKSESVNTPVR